jgi:ribosomal protein S3AE
MKKTIYYFENHMYRNIEDIFENLDEKPKGIYPVTIVKIDKEKLIEHPKTIVFLLKNNQTDYGIEQKLFSAIMEGLGGKLEIEHYTIN